MPIGKSKIVHQNWLASFVNGYDQEEEIKTIPDLVFEEFMGEYGGNEKVKYGVTAEQTQDLFRLPKDYSLVHSNSACINDRRELASVFRKKFGRLPDIKVKTLNLHDGSRYLFYLVIKNLSTYLYSDLLTLAIR